MAQSIEARTARYLHDNLARLDIHIDRIALATTAWSAPMKARLLRFILSVITLHAIDYEHGNFASSEEGKTLKRFATLNRFVRSMGNPLDLGDGEV